MTNTSHNDTGGIVESDDVDFDLVCQMHTTPLSGEANFCFETLTIECGNQNSMEGTIFSPEFPSEVTNESLFGTVLKLT